MASTNQTSLGLNKWEASDKPVRQDFVTDNILIDEEFVKVNTHLMNINGAIENIHKDSAWQQYTGFSKYSSSQFTINSVVIRKNSNFGYITINYAINSKVTDHVNLLTNIPKGFSEWQTFYLVSSSATPQVARLAVTGSDLIAVANGAIGTYVATFMYPLS